MPRRSQLLDNLVHADRIDADAERVVVAALALRPTDRTTHIVHVAVGICDLERIVIGNGGIRCDVRGQLARIGLVGRAFDRQRATIRRTLGLEVNQAVKGFVRDNVWLVAELAEVADLGDRNVGQGRRSGPRRRRARGRRERRERIGQNVANGRHKVLRARGRADVDVVTRRASDSRPIGGQRRGCASRDLRLLA